MSLEIKPICDDTEENRMMNKHFVSKYYEQYVEIGKDKFIMPKLYNEERAQEYLNHEVRDSDIYFFNHPKTGSTWLQELVWLINSDLDYESIPLGMLRFLFLEWKSLINLEKVDSTFSEQVQVIIQVQKEMEGPRYIKSHMHWSMLPKQIQDGTKTPKIFIAMRNPQDVCVSFYHYSKMMLHYTGNFEDFCELFMAGKVPWGPYTKQVLSGWEQRHRPNVCIIQYREMKEDFPATIRKVAKFLNKILTDDDVNKLADFLSLENMKNHPTLSNETHIDRLYAPVDLIVERTPFIRSGKEGGYKTVMSPEMIKKFEKWVEENITAKGVTF